MNTGTPGASELRQRTFYVHLYIGLFLEAQGKAVESREHLLLAADKFADDGYMGDVARAHASILRPPATRPAIMPIAFWTLRKRCVAFNGNRERRRIPAADGSGRSTAWP